MVLQEKSEFGSEEWEATGSRPSRWPQKVISSSSSSFQDYVALGVVRLSVFGYDLYSRSG